MQHLLGYNYFAKYNLLAKIVHYAPKVAFLNWRLSPGLSAFCVAVNACPVPQLLLLLLTGQFCHAGIF